MGQYNSNQLQHKQIQKLYTVIRTAKQNNKTYLKSKTKQQYFILKEYLYCEEQQFKSKLLQIQKRKALTNPHLTNIIKMQQQIVQNICSKLYKMHVLFQSQNISLAEQINRRGLEKRYFTYQQIIIIFSSIVKALIFLQSHKIQYQYLTAKHILFSQSTIKLIDPLIIDTMSNIEIVFHNRNVKNIYLSPAQCKLVEQENNLYLFDYGDVEFTLGVLMMEVGLLERQDQCYLENCSMVNQQVLRCNLQRVRSKYGQVLFNLLVVMLNMDAKLRLSLKQINVRLDKEMEMQRRKSRFLQMNSTVQFPFEEEVGKSHRTNNNKLHLYSSLTNPCKNLPPEHFDNTYKKPFRQDSPSKHQQKVTFKPSFQHQMKHQEHNNSPFQHELTTKNQITFNSSYDNKIVSKNQLAYLSTQGFYNSDSDIQECHEINLKIKTMKCFQKQKQKQGIKMVGQGQYVIEQFKLGSRYEGYKVNGLRQGYGVFYFQDGGKYDGDWLKNKMHGFGKLYYKSGLLAYQGNWRFDQFHGIGKVYNQNPLQLYTTFNYTNFDNIGQSWISYQGNFKHDIKQGKGKLILSNGNYYQGNFQCDQVSGEGIFFKMPNTFIKGIWRSNRLVRQI